MSRLRREMYTKKLRDFLSRADDEGFVQMVWATDSIQSGREGAVGSLFQFPKDAATTDMSAPLAVHKWELETLVSQLLTVPKLKPTKSGVSYSVRCDLFESMRSAVNILRDLEGAEAGSYLTQVNVLNEMHRIAHRQFPWQRGFFNRQEFYRAAFIYGGERSADWFLKQTGVEIGRFMLVGFVLFADLIRRPAMLAAPPKFPAAFPSIAAPTADEWTAALRLLVRRKDEARNEARRQRDAFMISSGGKLPLAFQPSPLRSRPVLAFGQGSDRLRAPLPDLIAARTTSGLYYDLVPAGPSELRNEVAARFEVYAQRLISEYVPEFDTGPSYEFRLKGKAAHTPDVLVRRGGELVLAIECKATKLTIEAQYSDDPFVVAKRRYGELVKAVLQLWRFFSFVRRGVLPRDPLAEQVMGLVLTHDAWLTMSEGLKNAVLDDAGSRADGEAGILPEDRRPIAFTNIAELELILAQVDGTGFLRSLATNATPEYRGWMLTNIPDVLGVKLPHVKAYPFDPGSLLPWMAAIKELREHYGTAR